MPGQHCATLALMEGRQLGFAAAAFGVCAFLLSGAGRPVVARAATLGTPASGPRLGFDGLQGLLPRSGGPVVNAADGWGIPSEFPQPAVASPPASASGSSADGDWEIVASANANAGADNFINGLTCVSSTACWAVGSAHTHPLIERYDGTHWSVAAAPATASGALDAVTCVAADDCWAVGYSPNLDVGPHTLVERWDGSAWSIVVAPNPGSFSVLNDVQCISAADCWAAGQFDTSVLTEHWDGASWTVVAAPDPGVNGDAVNALSCSSTSSCWAVGLQVDADSHAQTLVELWDGTAWHVVPSPNVSATVNLLFDVTCVTATDCWAVGLADSSSGLNQTLAEHWDGSSWSVVPTADVGATQSDSLLSVQCPASNDCWAVSYYYDPAAQLDQTLIERWDGSAWTIAGSPDSSSSEVNAFFTIACVSAVDCWTAGTYAPGLNFQTLAAHWDGSAWTIASSANATWPQGYLTSTTCVAASDCWAVGRYAARYNPPLDQTLIEHWEGSGWSLIPSPDVDPTFNETLAGVTCVSSVDCWAVGGVVTPQTTGGSVKQTLTEHWDGTAWSIVSSPNPFPGHDNYLAAVTCTSSSDCWAVGYVATRLNDTAFFVYQNLIEHWNGIAWTPFPSSSLDSSQSSILWSVTCVSATKCWSVGETRGDPTAGGGSQPLIEEWNGVAWAPVASPSPSGSFFNALSAVTCVSASDCSAGGFAQQPNNAIYVPLFERWDGAAWTISSTVGLDPSASYSITGITCTSATNCWGVGEASVQGDLETLAEHWDGSAWSPVPTQNVGGTNVNLLDSVTCTSDNECWAVGVTGSLDYGGEQSLIERFVATPSSAVPDAPWTPGIVATALLALGGKYRGRVRARRSRRS